ncbi:MAG: ankyrin repeat domain-containing protein [Rhodospirillales bacterium]
MTNVGALVIFGKDRAAPARRFFGPLVVIFVLVLAAGAHAAEIKGQVKAIAGDRITIRVAGSLAPQPGDPVNVVLNHPDLGSIEVGVWIVSEVKHPTVQATLKEATGDAEPLMEAVIVSENPVDVSARVEAIDKIARPDTGFGPREERLMKAAQSGDVDATRRAITAGANVNAADKTTAFPLAIAAREGHASVVKVLLEAGANPNLESAQGGQTALKVAAARGSNEAIEALLDAGAVIDYRGGEYRSQFSRVTALFVAADRGHAETVKLLIKRGADPYAENALGENALTYAVQGGHIDVVNAFVEAGLSIDYVSSTGITPLIAAAFEIVDNRNMFIYLLGAGANVNAQIPKSAKMDPDLIGMTPLMLTADGFGDLYLLLYAGADPQMRNARGQTAADIAAARLQEARAKGRPVKDQLERKRALANPESTKKRAQAKINELLSDMVGDNNVALAGSLLALGADPNFIDDNFDEPVLSLATREDFSAMAKLLVKNGASPNTPGKDRITPFLRIFEKRDADLIRFMLANGADAKYMPPGFPFNLIHMVAMAGFAEIIPDLVKTDIDVNGRGEGGNTPLHMAAKEEKLKSFEALLAAGANSGLRNDKGKTPLELVSRSKRGPYELALRSVGKMDRKRRKSRKTGSATTRIDSLERIFESARAFYGEAHDHPFDRERAFQMFTLLAGRGHAGSMAYLGLMFEQGQGTRRDPAKAAKWYRRAAEKGVASAQVNIGRMYEQGQGVKQDHKEALRWYQKAAAQNNGGGLYRLGRMYGLGRGVKKDYAEAMRWYQKAVARGSIDARNNIGFLYRNGLGVKRNYAEAMKWFRQAANGGNAHAMFNLGFLYAHGLGVRKDRDKAEQWYIRAGNKSGKYHLTNIAAAYENGSKGVPKDRDLAIRLYRRSAAAGNAKARQRLRELGVN